MRRPRMLLVLATVAATGGCGGAAAQRMQASTTAEPPAVADQVRDALRRAARGSAAGQTPPRERALPFDSVRSCTGPPEGGAGTYRCATHPHGSRGVRSVTVVVLRDGGWSTEPLRFAGRSGAVTALWGTGLRMP